MESLRKSKLEAGNRRVGDSSRLLTNQLEDVLSLRVEIPEEDGTTRRHHHTGCETR